MSPIWYIAECAACEMKMPFRDPAACFDWAYEHSAIPKEFGDHACHLYKEVLQ